MLTRVNTISVINQQQQLQLQQEQSAIESKISEASEKSE